MGNGATPLTRTLMSRRNRTCIFMLCDVLLSILSICTHCVHLRQKNRCYGANRTLHMSIIPFFPLLPSFLQHPDGYGGFSKTGYTAETKNSKQYTYEIPVPGMTKNNVEVYLDGNTVVVNGQRGQAFMKHAFWLPRDADVQRISATVQDGLLVITSPRIPVERNKHTRKITVL